MATGASIGRAYVGASGFSYPSWRGGFYPAQARPAEFLRFYAEHLPSVELNTTFYQLPSEQSFRRWAEQVPPGFRFAVKMTRSVTQFRNLSALPEFSARARLLGEALGPIRVNLAAAPDPGLLRLLLGSLEPGLDYAFDFPGEVPEADEQLAAAGVARVNALDGATGFRYVRLREPPYDDGSLAELAGRLRPLLAGGTDVYCYFRHEDEPTAPAYAAQLLELLAR